MNTLQQRCVGFSRRLASLASRHPRPSREHRQLQRGAVRMQGYAELLGGEVTATSKRLYRVAADDCRRTLARVGLDSDQVGQLMRRRREQRPGGRRAVRRNIFFLIVPVPKRSQPTRP